MKIIYVVAIDIIHSLSSDLRYTISRLLSYLAISFVMLTAIQLLWSYFIYYGYSQTNIYTIPISEDASASDTQEALKTFREKNQAACFIQLYSPYRNEFDGFVIGSDDFVHPMWTLHIYDDQLIKSDQPYVWMGSAYWKPDETIYFPYEYITINDTKYTVAGSCDIQIKWIPSYVDGVSDTTSILMPLDTYIKGSLPIEAVVLCYESPPSTEEYYTIKDSFSQVTHDFIEKRPSISFAGLSSPIAIACILALVIGLVFLSFEVYYVYCRRIAKLRAQWICGAGIQRLLAEAVLYQLIIALAGFMLAVSPALLVHLIDPFAIWLGVVDYMLVCLVFSCCVVITQGIAIRKALRNTIA